MTDENINAILQETPRQDIVLGLLYHHPGDGAFRDEDLHFALHKAQEEFPRLATFFIVKCSDEEWYSKALASDLNSARMQRWATYARNPNIQFLTDTGKRHIEEYIKPEKLDALKTLAEKVWDHAYSI
jgi:hypothetical protein